MGIATTSGNTKYTYFEKDTSSDTLVWNIVYPGTPSVYSFTMDSNQSFIYYLLNDGGNDVKFYSVNSSNGSLSFGYEYTPGSLGCNSDFWRIVITDNNSIYLSLQDSSSGYIWLYSNGGM